MEKMYLGETLVSELNFHGASNENKPVYREIAGQLYRQTLFDDFKSNMIDGSMWTNKYLPHRYPEFYRSTSDVYCKDSILHLTVTNKKPTVSASNGFAVSSIQTGLWNGMHLQDPAYHDFPQWIGFMAKEGYYELRAKIFSGNLGHSAWWMIGVENNGTPDVEIDIFEIPGANNTQYIHRVLPWEDGSSDRYDGVNENVGVDLSADYHVYGFRWEDGIYEWYFDGELIDTANVNTPQYPMIMFLSTYRANNDGAWSGLPDDTIESVEMAVDYIKIYKKATSESLESPTLVSIEVDPKTLIGGTYNIDDMTGALAGMQKHAYLYWSDGSRTEEWVQWMPYQKYEDILNNGGSFDWEGITCKTGARVLMHIIVEEAESVLNYENGYINNDGELTALDNNYVSTEYISVSETAIITINETIDNGTINLIRVTEYDSNKNFITRQYIDGNSGTFELDSSTAYIRVGFDTTLTGENLIALFSEGYTVAPTTEKPDVSDGSYSVGYIDDNGDFISRDNIFFSNNYVQASGTCTIYIETIVPASYITLVRIAEYKSDRTFIRRINSFDDAIESDGNGGRTHIFALESNTTQIRIGFDAVGLTDSQLETLFGGSGYTVTCSK